MVIDPRRYAAMNRLFKRMTTEKIESLKSIVPLEFAVGDTASFHYCGPKPRVMPIEKIKTVAWFRETKERPYEYGRVIEIETRLLKPEAKGG